MGVFRLGMAWPLPENALLEFLRGKDTVLVLEELEPLVEEALRAMAQKNGLTLTDAINVFFQQSLNAGGFPFAVTEDNAEIIKAKALSRLTKQLQEAQDDPGSYSEDEVYKMFGVEK